MAIRDAHRGDWISDVRAILDVNQKVAYDLHSMMCNIICHRVLEQLIENPDSNKFVIPLAPLGEAVIEKEDSGEWSLTSVDLGDSFKKAINETLRCKESRLYRDQYDRAYDQLIKNLKRFAAENLN